MSMSFIHNLGVVKLYRSEFALQIIKNRGKIGHTNGETRRKAVFESEM